MALVLKDRVRESSTSSGTGSITLAGAYTGYQSFATAITSGSTVYYTIHNTTSPNDGEWEVGVGTFTSPSTLSRDTVFSSSTGGSKVSFSTASTLEVFITQPSEQAVYINDATGKVEVFGNGTNTVSFTNVNTTNLTANTVTLTAGTISTNAANATDITNKTYVDGLFSTGISYHDPVLVEEDVALVAVYNQPNGAANGVGATLTNNAANVALVVDGVSVSNTARILVYAQANAVQNGVYTVTNPGNASAQWVLTRATDADTFGLANPNQLGQGDAFFVTDGDTGAGRTYICNTPGTITFGSTNITFAEISSSQIYAAGTGLNLANLTFSISNTAVTAATYGNDGAVGQFTVNAQGQLTNAANVSINASSISVGTLANGRTTAASANGASTIVLRDANGDFTANTITATTSNATTFNGTTGSFTNVSGNGVALTAINASNISSGTIDNARTTGNTSNSASTIVLRDADGSFGANIITATFSGNGATLSAINASNISSGTIANARTTASSSNGASTIVQRDSGGNFSANTVTAAVIGDLSGGSNINASNIASGTIANARTTASSSNGASTIVLRGASGEFAAGAITGTSFSGNGSSLTAINATAITTGTIDNARTTASSANGASTIVARDAGGNFSANTITATTFSGAMSGNGAAITSINASNISSGTIANARTTAATANGASTIVLRGTSGEFSAGIITADGSGLSAINASNISSGTIANARTTAASANGASTIVARDASGNFSAGTITATLSGSATSAGTATNQSGGTVAATTGSFSGQLSVAQSTSLINNGINLNAAGNGYLRGTANDTASSTQANVQLMSWHGIGFSPSITGQTVPQGENAVWVDCRSGTLNARSTITGASFSGAGTGLTGTASSLTAGLVTNGLYTTGNQVIAARTLQQGSQNVGTMLTASGSLGGFELTSAGSTNAAFMTFHKPGNYASYFGIDTDNQFAVGGWSAGGALANMKVGSLGVGTAASGTAGHVTATQFNGSGAGLTGTASSLSIGGSSGSTVYPAFSGDSVNIGAITSRIDSGFYENSAPTTGGGWPVTGSWYHLLASTHSNDANYYSMQIAASFFDSSNLYYRSTAGSGSTGWLSILTTSGATFSGNLTMSGTIQANSDEKLKTNWRSVQGEFVAKLAKVKSGVYDRVDKELTQVGVSAQSLQKLIPEAVVEGADGYLSVNYGGAAMVSCVEMAKVIEELRAEIAELKAKIKE